MELGKKHTTYRDQKCKHCHHPADIVLTKGRSPLSPSMLCLIKGNEAMTLNGLLSHYQPSQHPF